MYSNLFTKTFTTVSIQGQFVIKIKLWWCKYSTLTCPKKPQNDINDLTSVKSNSIFPPNFKIFQFLFCHRFFRLLAENWFFFDSLAQCVKVKEPLVSHWRLKDRHISQKFQHSGFEPLPRPVKTVLLNSGALVRLATTAL